MICGAANFSVGDRVPLALPGAELPGGFRIEAKPAYGRMSAGMICSEAELGIGDDHSGILVLPADAPLGADFAGYAGLRDVVLDIAVTPDRGYALSVRGVARELASAYGVPFTDPAGTGVADDAAAPARRPRCTRRASPTRPAATGSCCARCAAWTPRPGRRCGCGSGWPGPGCAASRWPSTSPTT